MARGWISGANLTQNFGDGCAFGSTSSALAVWFFYANSFNGTSWSNATGTSVGRQSGPNGMGTFSAGLVAGGISTSSVTEEFNGTSWSSGGNLNTARRESMACGTQTAGLIWCGVNSSNADIKSTEEYNGTSWSSGGDFGTEARAGSGCGTQTAGLNQGWAGSLYNTNTYEYDGTSWTLNSSGRWQSYYTTAFGSQTASTVCGGASGYARCAEYNGTTHTTSGSLNIGRGGHGGVGTQTDGLVSGGFDASWAGLNTTEEYGELPVVAPTVTTQSATNIATTSCTGNGNITDTGGENCTRRGFCYKVGTSGDPTTSDSVAYDDGSFGTGAFTKSITGLTPNTSYRVRAYAVNSAGTSYGTTVSVKTLTDFIPRTMWFN